MDKKIYEWLKKSNFSTKELEDMIADMELGLIFLKKSVEASPASFRGMDNAINTVKEFLKSK
tara:strand:+ start:1447 stop:1632 length:186 start_codon:yes stop_codon:yes gene_type:complete